MRLLFVHVFKSQTLRIILSKHFYISLRKPYLSLSLSSASISPDTETVKLRHRMALSVGAHSDQSSRLIFCLGYFPNYNLCSHHVVEEYISNELAIHSVEYQLYSTVHNLENQFLICHNANVIMITSFQPCNIFFSPAICKIKSQVSFSQSVCKISGAGC